MIGKDKVSSLRMEVICDLEFWILHMAFGFPGLMNDLNIQEESPHFSEVVAGVFKPARFKFNLAGEQFDWYYYLADGIYPEWKIFMTTATGTGKKAKKYASYQEAVWKSVERVFDVLFKRFNVLYMPSRLCYTEDMRTIMTCS